MDITKEEFLAGLGGGTANPTPPANDPPANDPPTGDPPANDPPTGDPPANNPPANDPPVGLNDEAKIQAINEAFGFNFTTIDQVEQFKSTLSELPTLQEVKQKYEEIKDQSVAKFANKTLEELNTFVSITGVDDPAVLKQLKQYDASETKDPIEALVLAEILKDPSLASKRDILYKSFKREYKTTYDQDLYGEELEEAQEKAEMEQLRLDRKANEAKKQIEETMGKVKSSGPLMTVNETIKQREALKAQWENVVEPNVTQLFGKIPVEVPVGKDKNGKDIMETVDYIELSPEEAKAYANAAIKNVVSSGLELTQENLISVISEQYDIIKAKNLTTIVSKAMSKAQAAAKLQAEKEATNPSSLRVQTPPAPNQDKTASEKIQEKWEKLMRGE